MVADVSVQIVVHDIERRRVLEVQKVSVDEHWRRYLTWPIPLPNSQPVPFFGTWSCFDVAAGGAGPFKPEVVDLMDG